MLSSEGPSINATVYVIKIKTKHINTITESTKGNFLNKQRIILILNKEFLKFFNNASKKLRIQGTPSTYHLPTKSLGSIQGLHMYINKYRSFLSSSQLEKMYRIIGKNQKGKCANGVKVEKHNHLS